MSDVPPNSMVRSAVGGYLLAFGAALVGLLVQKALHPLLGDYLPYIAFFPVIAFTAWLCGIGPSILAVLVALAGARYWFIAPAHPLGMAGPPEMVGMVAFAVAAGAIIAIATAFRRSDETTRGELETRIRERTAELDTANQSLSDLTGRLLKLQDEERRRIARELHDSVGQTLAALSMNLSSVGADLERLLKAADTVADSAALVDNMCTDIRTITYLLHPPLLDEAGLSSALRWYVRGFAERSKINVSLEFPEDFGRLSQDLETAIFRVIQECLTNVHRHSESPVAIVRLAQSAAEVRIEVEDRGKGISPEKQHEVDSRGLLGVGMRGMRERLRQLGGSLEIISEGDGQGATVIARLPMATEHQGSQPQQPPPPPLLPIPPTDTAKKLAPDRFSAV